MNISSFSGFGSGAMRALAALLVVAAFPVAAAAALALLRLENVVRDQAQDYLSHQAGVYGQALRHRLETARGALELIAGRLGAGDMEPVAFERARHSAFDHVAFEDRSGRHTLHFARDGATPLPETAPAAAPGERGAAIRVAPVAGAEPRVLITMPATSTTHGAGRLVAALNRDWLWKSLDASRTSLDISVMDENGAMLFTTEKSSGVRATDRMTSRSDVAHGFLPGAGAWTVVAAQAAPDVQAAWRWQDGLLLAVSLLVGGLIAFAALGRRPPRAAKTASSTRTEVRARDAPGEPTALRLERQVRAMTAFAEIDRAILSRASMDHVVESVLRNAPGIVRTELIAVTLLDRDAPMQARTIAAAARQGRKSDIHRTTIDAELIELLAPRPDGHWLDDGAAPSFLVPLARRGATRFLLLPVFWNANVAAILAFGLPGKSTLIAEERTFARDFAERLGVALAATRQEEDLEFRTHYDETTALPNRRLFKERLTQEVGRARRESRPIALLFIDLDDFRKINERIGDEAGDKILEQAAQRLKHSLRAEDIVARFGGDEFAVLLPAIAAVTDAAKVAEKLIAHLSRPYRIGREDHHLTASIGISVSPGDADSADKLLRNADFAMYRAKSDGRGQYVFYEARTNALSLERTTIELDLRRALSGRELTLHYQPQIDLRSGAIIGAEALVRWNHPKRGLVPPVEFIGVAEQCGLIEEIGHYVRSAACAQLRAWESEGLPLTHLSMNLSSREIRRKDFVERMEAVLRETGVRPYCLEVEITESLLVDNSDHVQTVLKWLSDRGIKIAIDDFGTGYSSMAYLRQLPFDGLKVDRSFIRDLGKSDGSDAIVNAILGIARSLGKEVIAEGVETEAQRDHLAQAGCDAAQGYLWSRPLPPEAFAQLARSWDSLAPRTSAESPAHA